jgi:hypothetical protein
MKTVISSKRRARALALTALTLIIVTGCGKTNAAKPAAAATPTHAQVVAAADAICAATRARIDPLIAEMTAIQHSGATGKETRLKTGPLLEEIAGGNRVDGRLLMEVPTGPNEHGALFGTGYTMLELSVMEEQLAQGLRTNEPSRINDIAPDVLETRSHARAQARQFGLKICAQTPQARV